ncbi:hypothetical protein SAMN04489860_0425 [Paraoerskovia marina]|uniref:Uncharacterized protein n=1 Tax=Paraoerskovia marina TaxID=545619 RepID=A0A1H1N3F5_9CELL|nr:DUF6049 family protein [Paraoerskovia marina]SDR93661.1 hypothetical protein SAMN04489860_0425 [Paraoerskovia marina]
MTHPRSGAWARAVAVLAAIGAFSLGTVPAASADDATSNATVSIGEVTPAILDYDTEVTVVATVTNTGSEPITGATARLGIDREDGHTRSWVETWSTADDDGPVGLEILTEEIDEIEPGEDASVTFEFTRAQAGIGSWTDWGAHGIAVAVNTGDGVVVDRTFVVWSPEGSDDVAPVQVGLLAPVVGPLVSTDPTTAELALTDAVRPDSRLADVVAATEDQPIAWAVDPWLVQEANLVETDDAKAWVADVVAGAQDRDVFALPALDPDPAALAHAGERVPRLDVTGPGSEWRTDLIWPAPAPDRETVAASADAADFVVVTGALAPSASSVATPDATTRVDVDGSSATAVVADESLSDLITRATSGDAEVGDARQVMAETATIAAERPSQTTTVLAAFPRDWTPDAELTADALSALDALPWAGVVDLDTVLETTPTPGSRTPLPASVVADAELDVADVDLLVRDRASIAEFSTIVEDPDALLAEVDPALVAPTAIAGRDEPEARDSDVVIAHGRAAELLDAVSIVESSDYNLIAESGDLRVNVQNDLGQDATVQVVLEPDDSALQADTVPPAVITAGTVTPVPVPVTAVGSGDVNVTISILAPDGSRVADSSTFEVRVRADWAGVGLWVISIILGGFLVGGIWRTVRRHRRNTATARSEQGATP